MPGPWEKYAKADPSSTDGPKPWERYAPAGAGPGEAIGPSDDPSLGSMAKTAGKALVKLGSNALQGVGESALGSMTGTDEWARAHLPAVLTNSNLGFGKPADLEKVKALSTPENALQAVFKGAGDVGQFFVPGEAEEAGAAKLASLAPWAGKAAKPLARIATGAVSSGAVNRAQGGTFTGGALTAAAAGGAGELAKLTHLPLIRSAGSFRDPQLMTEVERTPAAEAISNYTSGIRPITIARQAAEKEGEWSNIINAMDKATGEPARMGVPRAVLADEARQAEFAMNPTKQRLIKQLQMPLTFETSEGKPVMRTIGRARTPGGVAPAAPVRIPPLVAPERMRAAKQAVGDMVLKWPPDLQKVGDATKTRLYKAIENELDQASPGTADYDTLIHNIIPGKNAFRQAAQWSGVPERVMGRIARPTGALAGAGFGGYMGYQRGGAPGAVAGGLMGLVAPEILSSPEGKMAMARAVKSPLTSRTLRAVATPAARALSSRQKAQPWAATE